MNRALPANSLPHVSGLNASMRDPGATLVGRRVTQAQLYDHDSARPGDYAPYEHGGWIIRDPYGRVGRLHPSKHRVTEHEDGTISVTPSILDLPDDDRPASEQMGGVFGAIVPGEGGGCWHGFLERGVWRTA